jgi:hypothetical protein
MANWQLEIVRLTSTFANAVILLLAQALPCVALVIALRQIKGRRRWAVTVGLAPVVLASLAFGALLCFGLLVAGVGDKAAFERIKVVRAETGTVAVYRTNGGATTNFGIILRQEAVIFPGVLLVRRLDHFYPASDASVEVIGPDQVRVKLGEEDGILSDPFTRVYRLRRLVLV